MDPRLQRAQALLRNTGLLTLVDDGRWLASELKHLPSNRRFKKERPGVPTPPSRISWDAHGTVDWKWFEESGRKLAGTINGLIERHAKDGPLDVLEWGCGGARVLSHMPALLPEGSTVSGSDYNPTTIAWCRDAVRDIRFELNSLEPPLVFDDASFDAIYSISVLTHLSEALQGAWIKELARVLRPGGIIIVTVKGASFKPILLPEEVSRWESGDLIVRDQVEEGKRMYGAFHPVAYMEKLLADYEILEHIPSDNLKTQDFWIARVPS
jgi:SAM-dependent methyltransferase